MSKANANKCQHPKTITANANKCLSANALVTTKLESGGQKSDLNLLKLRASNSAGACAASIGGSSPADRTRLKLPKQKVGTRSGGV